MVLILWTITSCSSPQLGGYVRDVETYVKELQMIDGEQVVDIYCGATIMLNKIDLQADSSCQVNLLLYRFVLHLSSLADSHQSLEHLHKQFTHFPPSSR